MKKVGEILREERERQRKQLSHIADLTKIRAEYLQAIEENDFQSLPPSAFVRGFLQNYAQVLGMNDETVLALFRRDFKVGDRGKIIPREYLKPLHRRRTLFTPQFVAMGFASLIVFGVVFFAAMQWNRLRQPPQLTVFSPEDNQTVNTAVEVTGRAQIDAVVWVNEELVALDADGTFEKEVFLTGQGEQTITVVAEDRNQRTTTIRRKVVVE